VASQEQTSPQLRFHSVRIAKAGNLRQMIPKLPMAVRPLGDGFDALCDAEAFAKVYLEHGALTWPGGIDLAPDAMYQRICESGTSTLAARSRKVA
jgi:hypothetical protein